MIEKKHNYFYKITNLVNGKYYYGIHSTNNLDDGYMGGGTVLRRAIKKQGLESFTKEIITDYPTRKEASDHEARVVNADLVESKECYNIRYGGDSRNFHSKETREKISRAHSGEKNVHWGKSHTERHRHNISTSLKKTLSKVEVWNKGKTKENCESMKKVSTTLSSGKHANLGKPLSSVTKNRISEANTGKKRSNAVVVNAQKKSSLNKGCFIEGAYYFSISEASRILKIPHATITSRLNSNNFKEWRRVDDYR